MTQPFYPTTAYDWPSAQLADAFTGHLSALGKAPQDLTPEERTTIAGRVTQAMGWQDDPFLSSVAESVLNPWVLMMAGASLFTHTALPAAGELFNTVGRSSAFVRKFPLVAQTLKLLGPGQVLRGTHLETAFMQADKEISELRDLSEARLAPSLRPVLTKYGLREGLDTKSPISQEIGDLLHIKLAGLDQERMATVLSGGSPSHRILPALVDRGLVDQRVGELGIQPLVDAYRAELGHTKQLLFGTEGSATFQVDGSKVYKLHRNLKNSVFQGATADALSGLLGEDLTNAVAAGEMSKEEFLGQVAQRFSGGLDEQHYMPRNVYTAGRPTPGGWREIPPDVNISQREGRIIASANASAPRTKFAPTYWVPDLERLRKFAVDQSEIDGQIEQAHAFAQKALNDGKQSVRFDSIDFGRSIQKYMNEAMRSKAMFLSAPDEAVIAAQERSLPLAAKAIADGQHRYVDSTDVPKFRDDVGFEQSTLEPTRPDHAPLGGWSLADTIWQGHQLVNDRVTQNTISRLFVPMVMGQMGPRSSLLVAVQQHAQNLAGRLADLPVWESGGEMGRGVQAKLRDYEQMDVKNATRAGFSGRLTGYLYGTHIGLNLSTVVANLLQPIVTTSRFVETPYMIEGYGKAIKSMGEYVKGRMEMGGAFPAPEAKLALMGRAFGHDVLEDASIGPSALESMDSVGFTGERYRQGGGFMDKLTNFSMKGFEKSEWMNRLSTVYAQRAKQAAAGMDIMSPVARDEVRTLVNETQFGGHWLNTPELFLDPNSPLSNPLLRQFMTFPTRMLTLTTNTAPLVGGPNAGFNAFRDISRAMGMSALVYETGKHLLGPDIDRDLYASTVAQILTNPPVPPAIGIPFNATQGFLTGDWDMVKKQIPRLLPGGVAASRLLNLAPQLPAPFGAVQRKYVDWNDQLPTGEVAVRKPDGSLINYDSPTRLVAQYLGVPAASGAQSGDLDKWLIRQREQTVQYRQQYMTAVTSNDSATAGKVQAEFKERFGYDLSVGRNDFDRFRKMRRTPRSQRTFLGMPQQARQMYSGFMSEAAGPNAQGVTDGFQRLDAGNQRFAAGQQPGQPIPPQPGPGIFEPFTALFNSSTGEVGGHP